MKFLMWGSLGDISKASHFIKRLCDSVVFVKLLVVDFCASHNNKGSSFLNFTGVTSVNAAYVKTLSAALLPLTRARIATQHIPAMSREHKDELNITRESRHNLLRAHVTNTTNRMPHLAHAHTTARDIISSASL